MNNTILALDTNIWIYLAEKPENLPILDKLEMGVDSGEYHIIICDIIKNHEWPRNKSNILKKVTDSIKSQVNTAQNLAQIISVEEDKKKFLEIISKYKQEQERIEEANKRIERVEALMNRCELVVATDEQKLFIANLAINNLPPFQNRKNNFNDALIVRCLFQAAVNKILFDGNAHPNKYDYLFVSNNPDDFIDPKTGKIYDSILDSIEYKDCLEESRMINVRELPKALNLSKELIDDYDEWFQYMLDTAEQRYLDWAELQCEIARGK